MTAEAAVRAALHPGGPTVVAIGGGHGLARSLGAARRYAGSITAVVSVADDGGSSGRLRRDFAIPAPGDVRRALVALLPEGSPLTNALEHRFATGDLEGHAFGNLLLAALAAEYPDFVDAVTEACRALGTVGEVLPATSVPVTLCAEAAGHPLAGQVRIMGESGLSRVSLDPPSVEAPKAVLEAIAKADQVIVGPGSLYTSVLAALAPAGVVEALRDAAGSVLYVANLKEQVPETAGYDVGQHLAALAAHGVVPDVVLCDSSSIALGDVPGAIEVVTTPLAGAGGAVHDEALLAAALSALWAASSRSIS